MNKLESMAVFVRVAEKGSFAAVAEEMGISATMVGMHIKALETLLGIRLLNRTTRRQSLTAFGHTYYPRCCDILARVEDAELLAGELQATPRGRLRIACPVTFGVHALSPMCADFLARYPQVNIDLVLSDVIPDMAEQSIDIAIRIGETENINSYVARALAPYRSVICATDDYLQRFGIPQQPADLRAHRCLGFAHPQASQYWTLQVAGKSVRVPVNLCMAVNNGEALRTAALKGLGIIMQPEILLAEEIRQQRLVPLLEDFLPPPKPMQVVSFADRHQLPAHRLFMAMLIRHFAVAQPSLPAESARRKSGK